MIVAEFHTLAGSGFTPFLRARACRFSAAIIFDLLNDPGLRLIGHLNIPPFPHRRIRHVCWNVGGIPLLQHALGARFPDLHGA
jgi:hypothetical protein